MFRSNRLSRRGFLGGACASAAALPFMSNLIGRSVHAADGDAHAKRLLVFFTPNEPLDRDHWKPDGSGSEYALTSLPSMMSGLEAHMQQLLMIGGLKIGQRDEEPHGAGHVGIGHMLTNRYLEPYGSGNPEFWAGGISIDQHVANHLGVDALTLGAKPGGSNGNCRISYTGANAPVHPLTRPDEAFDQLFGDATLPEDELAALRSRRLSVLDRVVGDLQSIKSGLPTEARHKVDSHLDRVRDLETKLHDDTLISCDPMGIESGPDYGSNAAFPLTARRQIDLMVQALACGITDVGSLQLSNSGAGDLTPLWSDEGININENCHEIAHNYAQNPGGTNTQQRVALETFFFDMFGYLLDSMAAVPDGEGTLLDSTLVLWCKNLGYNHRSEDMLFMLAGGSGGTEMGRYLNRSDELHGDLLVSICNLMGMDDDVFGDPQFCTGGLSL